MLPVGFRTRAKKTQPMGHGRVNTNDNQTCGGNPCFLVSQVQVRTLTGTALCRVKEHSQDDGSLTQGRCAPPAPRASWTGTLGQRAVGTTETKSHPGLSDHTLGNLSHKETPQETYLPAVLGQQPVWL